MLAKYFVYEQHMKEVGTQAQEGYQEARTIQKGVGRKLKL